MRSHEQAQPALQRGWLGQTVAGRYEVLSLIGTGGMGAVFRARDIELDELVALKVLRRDLLEVPGVVERFRREVKLARRVTHRNVARVFDIAEHAGDKFLTMELVLGEALAERLRRGSIRRGEALRIALAIADGLTAAHAAGVIHRDLKPENVLVAQDGRVVITDFGIARAHIDESDVIRTMGEAVGTPAYMAPEQLETEHTVDARADIYAFGAVMFELFTGRRAWPGNQGLAVAAARLVQPPPDPRSIRPDLPSEYGQIVLRCLARRPEDRFPSAEAVAHALRLPSAFLFDEDAPGPDGETLDDPQTAATWIQVGVAPASLPVSAIRSASSSEPVSEPFAGPSGAAGSAAPTLVPSSPRPSHTMPSPAPRGFTARRPEPQAPAVAPPPPFAPSSAPPSPAALRTVAVLPFRNAGSPEDEYLADGLTDELIDTLSMTNGLRVRSRGVVMQHKGTDADPREVGARLDVGLVVEGSIRRTPTGVRITARVVSVRDGSQLWAKRFDKATMDVFDVSDEVARAVAEALSPDAPAPPAREAPADPVAMDLYLRGRQEYRRYWPDAVSRSVTLFEEALSRAPDHPTILSAYALSCARMWWFGGEGGAACGVKGRAAAEKALLAAPHLGEPHLALAQVMWNSADATGTAREITRALSRSPTLAEAQALRGRLLVEADRIEAGVKNLETAIALEPNAPLAVGELARARAFLGQWGEVPPLIERNAQLEGPQTLWFMRARFALWQRDRATAANFLSTVKPGQRVLSVARWLFEQILAPAPSESIDLSFFVWSDDASARRRSFVCQIDAEVRAYHGQYEVAARSIERAVREGLFDLAWLNRCPLLIPMHELDRFRAARAVVEERVRLALSELG